jgi:hypothetical protein
MPLVVVSVFLFGLAHHAPMWGREFLQRDVDVLAGECRLWDGRKDLRAHCDPRTLAIAERSLMPIVPPFSSGRSIFEVYSMYEQCKLEYLSARGFCLPGKNREAAGVAIALW